MALLSAVYNGSRSIRAGITWLVLNGFPEPGAEMGSVLLDKIGVDRLTVGRLKAAGSMSGMVEFGELNAGDVAVDVACGRAATRNAKNCS